MPSRRASLLVALHFAMPASARADVPPGFVEEVVAQDLERPVSLAVAPDGRVFIGEQYSGKIKVLKNGNVLDRPFAAIQPVWKGHNESGLVGLCVDPLFAKNGCVYAFVTQTNEVQRVWRYKAKGDAAEGEPTLFVDRIPTNGQNHDGGGIAFGPDGCFYVSVGESGAERFQKEAQDLKSWRGKVLRFTREGKIPPNNPFGPDSAVFCYGLRNSFRLAFQPGTGKLYASENGPNQDDEINLLAPKGNYGWPIVTGCAKRPEFRDPVYFHPGPRLPSITGIAFYTGDKLPFKGDLFYTCHNFGQIGRIRLGGKDGDEVVEHDPKFVTNVPNPVEVVTGPDGALWYTNLGVKVPGGGKIYRATAKR